MPDNDSLLKRYEREKAARLKAEAILAEKSRELYDRSEELRKLTVTLEEKVQSRTEELSIARDQALRAARAKADFLAHMSHEIRTPLNGVLGMLDMLQETSLDQQQQQLAETAATSGEHLLAILNDILDFSKIEAGMMTLELAPVQLRPLLQDVVDTSRAMIGDKSLQLQLNIADELPETLLLDSLRTRQVLLNLLSNAIKFTDEGKVGVVAEVDDGQLCIAVQDTGIGMNEEERRRIFQAFSQADSSTSRRFGGTGLGLSITHKLVDLMGGDIAVSSTPGHGSIFLVHLPLTQADRRSGTGQANSEETSLRGFRVMLVEDNAVNQLIARHMLEKLQVDVVLCNGGQQALDWLADEQHQKVDLILMDLQMPGMNGFEATAKIRAMGGSFEQLPIIAMTAHASEENRRISMEQGLDEHLSKPFKIERLSRLLHDFLVSEVEPLKTSRTGVTNRQMSSAEVMARLETMKKWLAEDLLVVEEIARELLTMEVAESDRELVSHICHLALDFDLDELESELNRILGL